MRDSEFEIITILFIPLGVDLEVENEVYNIRGEILIPEASVCSSVFHSPIADLYGDWHIAFFAETITIFGVLEFNISSEPYPYYTAEIISPPFYPSEFKKSAKKLALSFRGKNVNSLFLFK